MSNQISDLYEFGECRLDAQRRLLTRDGHAVPLPPKSFDLLLLLLQSQGRALSKQELMTALWPDVFVEEANLSFQISALRKALGDGASQWLETIPRHGYRFAAPVRAVPARSGDVAQSATPVVADAAPVAHPGYRRRWITGILALLAVVIALSVGLLERSTTQVKSAAPVPVAVPLTTDSGYENMPSLSPDGSQVAFAWSKDSKPDSDIYVKLVGPGEPIQLTSDPSHDLNPAWSPDGSLIAFERCTTTATSDLYVIPALGGAAERRIATGGAGCGSFKTIAWTPDGERLAWAGGPGIWLFDIHRLEKRQLTVDGRIPAFSEDGRRMAYIRDVGPGVAVHVLPLNDELAAAGPPVLVTPGLWMIRTIAWTPHGDALLYSAAGWLGVSRLYRVALAANRLEPAGSPQLLPFGENGDTFSLSRKTGRLVYSAFLRDTALMRLDLKEPNRAPVPVADSTYDEYTPDYSPDGRRIAFTSTRTGVEEIWIADADGSKPVRMTTMNGPVCASPHWSSDGRKILFHSTGSATTRALYALDVTTGAIQRLTDGPNRDSQSSWSRDGQTIYFLSRSQSPPRREIWKMPAGGGTHVQVTRHGGLFGIESFDRRVLYYAKPVGSDFAIWRVPVDGGEEVAVTGVGLTDALNFAVAREGVYFVSGSSVLGGLMGDTPRGKDTIDFIAFQTGRRRTILELGKRAWMGIAVSPDERYLLYSVVNSISRNLMLVDKFE